MASYYVAVPPVEYPAVGRVSFYFEEREVGTDKVLLRDKFTTDLVPVDALNPDGTPTTQADRVAILTRHVADTFAHIALGKAGRLKAEQAKAGGDGREFELRIARGLVRADPAVAADAGQDKAEAARAG